MRCCKRSSKLVQEYDPQPTNKDGSIRWFLYRWDDGKSGVRRLMHCSQCGSYHLVQAYHLNRFSEQNDILFEDWYAVSGPQQAGHLNRIYTGIQLEHHLKPAARFADGVPLDLPST